MHASSCASLGFFQFREGSPRLLFLPRVCMLVGFIRFVYSPLIGREVGFVEECGVHVSYAVFDGARLKRVVGSG